MEVVGSFDDAFEAYIAKGRLLAEGIESYISDEHYIGANWTMSFALGGVKLNVNRADKALAQKILSDLSLGKYQDCLENAPSEDLCPVCNHGNVTYCNPLKTKLFQVLVYFLFSIVLRARKTKCQCKHCGKVSNRDASLFTQPDRAER